jgi:hypothetical protein
LPSDAKEPSEGRVTRERLFFACENAASGDAAHVPEAGGIRGGC